MICCKGKCDYWTETRPAMLPFLTHSRCRTCDKWMKNEDVLTIFAGKRCPCCHGRVSNRPRLNSNKRKYIELRLHPDARFEEEELAK